MQVPSTQVPIALHVCVSVPQLPQATGLSWPGAHEPAHAPETHVVPVHATALPKLPVESQVSTSFPVAEHVVLPGTHMPEHCPWLQTNGQVAPVFFQAPAMSHD